MKRSQINIFVTNLSVGRRREAQLGNPSAKLCHVKYISYNQYRRRSNRLSISQQQHLIMAVWTFTTVTAIRVDISYFNCTCWTPKINQPVIFLFFLLLLFLLLWIITLVVLLSAAPAESGVWQRTQSFFLSFLLSFLLHSRRKREDKIRRFSWDMTEEGEEWERKPG